MYHVIRWEVKKDGFINNYSRGYEIFKTKKALNEYMKVIGSECTTSIYIVNNDGLKAIINRSDKTIHEYYGVIEVLEIQFH